MQTACAGLLLFWQIVHIAHMKQDVSAVAQCKLL